MDEECEQQKHPKSVEQRAVESWNIWAVALIQKWSDDAVQADRQKLRDDHTWRFSNHITAKEETVLFGDAAVRPA